MQTNFQIFRTSSQPFYLPKKLSKSDILLKVAVYEHFIQTLQSLQMISFSITNKQLASTQLGARTSFIT